MSGTEADPPTPKAVVHRKILDVAESEPNASMEELADEVAGASIDLVERVLEEYGDPSRDEQDEQAETDEAASTQASPESDMTPDENGRTDEAYSELSAKQLKALRLIEENPDASQSDLAEAFDVTRATVNRWLNDIPGFEWTRRAELAAEILNGTEPSEQNGPVETERIEELAQQVDEIERRLDELEAEDRTESTGFDPEFAHKVVHACMRSEHITEDEELRLLEGLLA